MTQLLIDATRKDAHANLAKLGEATYTGRGIIVGRDDTGRMIQVYWITGRSENSQNRVFRHNNTGRLFTEAADPARVIDPSLIIYNAMQTFGDYHIVSNGDQTDTVLRGLAESNGASPNLYDLLRGRFHEPDEPHYTPRITAVSWFGPEKFAYAQVSTLRRSRFDGNCDRSFHTYTGLPRGLGFCVTTYTGEDTNPLPSFRGEPYLVPLEGSPRDIVERYWKTLNPDNRVAIAVKSINRSTGETAFSVINRHAVAD